MPFPVKMLFAIGVILLLALEAPATYEASCTGRTRAAVFAWHAAEAVGRRDLIRVQVSRPGQSAPIHHDGRRITPEDIRTYHVQVSEIRRATAEYDWARVESLLTAGPSIAYGEWTEASIAADAAIDTCENGAPARVGLALGVLVGQLWSSSRGLAIDSGEAFAPTDTATGGGPQPGPNGDAGTSPAPVRRSLAFD